MQTSSLCSSERRPFPYRGELQLPAGAPDSALSDPLRKVVRRILRTQICRTCFQVRVLQEAQRVLDTHVRELAKDTLELLVVERLLGKGLGEEEQDKAAEAESQALCPATQIAVSQATVTNGSAAD